MNIGVEMDSHYFTAYCYDKLKQGLPNAKIKDSERLVNWARLIKSKSWNKSYEGSGANITTRDESCYGKY